MHRTGLVSKDLKPWSDFINCFAPCAKLFWEVASQKLSIGCRAQNRAICMIYAVCPTFMKPTPGSRRHWNIFFWQSIFIKQHPLQLINDTCLENTRWKRFKKFREAIPKAYPKALPAMHLLLVTVCDGICIDFQWNWHLLSQKYSSEQKCSQFSAMNSKSDH